MKVHTVKLAIAGSFGYMDIGDEAMLSEDLRFIQNDLGIRKENIYLFGENLDYISRYHDYPSSHCYFSGKVQMNWEMLLAERSRRHLLKQSLQ